MKPFFMNFERKHFIVAYDKKINESVYLGKENVYTHAWLTIDNGNVFIDEIYVPEKDRNSGLGTSILQFIIDESKRRGYKKIELSPSSAFGSDIDKLITFYLKFGFKENGSLYQLLLK